MRRHPWTCGAWPELVRRHPKYRPLVVCDDGARPAAERVALEAISWTELLMKGLAHRSSSGG